MIPVNDDARCRDAVLARDRGEAPEIARFLEIEFDLFHLLEIHRRGVAAGHDAQASHPERPVKGGIHVPDASLESRLRQGIAHRYEGIVPALDLEGLDEFRKFFFYVLSSFL